MSAQPETRTNPFSHFFPRPRLDEGGKPAAPLLPIRKDELAAMIEAFKAKGGEVQKLPEGFAGGTITTSYGPILR